jgi:hypothetical protein
MRVLKFAVDILIAALSITGYAYLIDGAITAYSIQEKTSGDYLLLATALVLTAGLITKLMEAYGTSKGQTEVS